MTALLFIFLSFSPMQIAQLKIQAECSQSYDADDCEAFEYNTIEDNH